MTALLIDLDGVLYEADEPVPGAAAAIEWLRENGVPHLFLTNTTSRPRAAIVEKLADMDIDTTEEDILTPPVAAMQWLAAHAPGPTALFVAPATVEEFAALKLASAGDAAVTAVVIGDYGERWSFAELNRAFRLLMHEPRPSLVALGMTRYWQAEDGLRLDTGPFVMALAHASGVDPVVLGKPARPFFETAMAMLNTAPCETLMVGDDIQGDIGGAQAAGTAGALVRTGKFRAEDLAGDIRPEFVFDSFAEIPGRWPDIVDALPNTAS
ncbi:MAG: TIGR01458 family HAD-type hydrolase [Gammaproteobacteria bacterium]|nr:TIGR01458 family HAD-type hydrolase [Gammaproteobacteria bacterium]